VQPTQVINAPVAQEPKVVDQTTLKISRDLPETETVKQPPEEKSPEAEHQVDEISIDVRGNLHHANEQASNGQTISQG
jgi:hypothetical protein